MRPQHLALIGPNQQENLALQYLAAAAEQAGHHAELVGYNSRDDLPGAVDTVLEMKADVVGLGIAFQYCIDDYLLLARTLRERDYAGHITCGGHVPSFCYEQLLRDCSVLDTAVRHDGELTLVALLDALRQGEKPRDIPGLVWRDGSSLGVGSVRAPVDDLDRLPLPKRGAEPYCVAGVPIAFLITARGCVGDCAYCSIRAYGRDAGGKPYRMRDAEAVAEEVARLYHIAGARVFFVQDDLFILPNQDQTVSRMHSIARALRERGVEDIAFWIKGRPESVTPAVLQAAREMGAIHLFLGVENASADRLSYLGRVHRPEDNQRALELCGEHGIRPSFNLMLFDPDCSLQDVAKTIDFAGQHLSLPWNVCRTEIYSGTKLLERLRAQGRLEGDYRSYGYRMRDSRAEVMFRILRVCFHEHAFAFDSLLNRLISLSFARQVHERFFPGQVTDALVREVEELIVETHRDSLDILRRALDFVGGADLEDAAAIRRYAIEAGLGLGSRDLSRHARAERLWERLHVRGWTLLKHGRTSA